MTTFRRSLLAAIAAVAFLAAPSTSRAEGYVALKGGVWVPTANDGFSTIGGIAQGQFPTSGDIELAYGATMGILGVQIAGGYMWSNLNGVHTNAIPFYGLLQLRLPIFFIQPYLEAGIGGLANFASVDASAGGVAVSGAALSFLAIGGAGVDFFLGPILLGVEARYMYATQQNFDFGSMRLSGVNITANVGYIF
jgi:hypothetical protein